MTAMEFDGKAVLVTGSARTPSIWMRSGESFTVPDAVSSSPSYTGT